MPENRLRFERAHCATAFKYAGISFIAGAVNHGFFSEERSLITAMIGVVMFVVGTWLEYQKDHTENGSLITQIGVGALFSIGLGFFTGGLQHFPDSPQRSLWVVPLGFSISVVALKFIQKYPITRAMLAYATLTSVFVFGGAYGAYDYYAHHQTQLVNNNPSIGVIGSEHEVKRTIVLETHDDMKFSHSDLEVLQGQTIKFVIKNTGQVAHEFVIDSQENLAEHAKVMAQHAAQGHHMQHDAPNMISLNPGESKELIWHFTSAGVVDYACLVPGHFEAGMKGRFLVRANTALSHESTTHQHTH